MADFASMIFWSLRLFLLLAVVPLSFFDWRQAVVVAYALVIQFVILIGMTMPTFGLGRRFSCSLPYRS